MTERRRDIPSKSPRSRDGSSTGGLVKLFYRIGEVARIVGVAPHVLRYWETEFPSIKPQKSTHGQRVYTKRDVHKLLLIKSMLKEQGLTIAGARKQMRAQSAKLFTEPLAEVKGELRNSIEATNESHLPSVPAVNERQVDSPSEEETIALPGVSSKSLRQTLLTVRRELVDWLSDLR